MSEKQSNKIKDVPLLRVCIICGGEEFCADSCVGTYAKKMSERSVKFRGGNSSDGVLASRGSSSSSISRGSVSASTPRASSSNHWVSPVPQPGPPASDGEGVRGGKVSEEKSNSTLYVTKCRIKCKQHTLSADRRRGGNCSHRGNRSRDTSCKRVNLNIYTMVKTHECYPLSPQSQR
jgi:hypothetical protein